MKTIKPFAKPIYVTRPLLPDMKALEKKLSAIWESKWLTNNGAQHQLLEAGLKKYLDVPSLSLISNGTIALMIAIRSLRLSKEVITTPFTFPATPHSLYWNNIMPVFCDIDYDTMTIDTDGIESMITADTTGILATHIFGVPCDVAGIEKIARRRGLKVIYDAAHAFGTEIDGRSIGSFGDMSVFSFHSTKLFHTVEGGAIASSDIRLKEDVDLLRNFGIKNEDEVSTVGINGKMNEIQAAMGLLVLDEVEEERRKRKKLSDLYCERLYNIEGIRCVTSDSRVKNSYQYFVVRIDKDRFGMSRDEVYAGLKKYNVFSRKYFYPLCSDYECYKNLPSAKKLSLPNAQKIAGETLSMPFYGALSSADAEKICEILIGLKHTAHSKKA